MAMKIRLARGGSKKRPHYAIVATDSRMPRDGRFLEKLGTYNPLLPRDSEDRIKMDMERVQYWLGQGAQPTEAVEALLKITGDWQKFKGEPGAEGTLKVKEPKADKKALYEAALAASGSDDAAGDPTPKKKAAKKDETPAAEAPAAADATPAGDAETAPAADTDGGAAAADGPDTDVATPEAPADEAQATEATEATE